MGMIQLKEQEVTGTYDFSQARVVMSRGVASLWGTAAFYYAIQAIQMICKAYGKNADYLQVLNFEDASGGVHKLYAIYDECTCDGQDVVTILFPDER